MWYVGRFIYKKTVRLNFVKSSAKILKLVPLPLEKNMVTIDINVNGRVISIRGRQFSAKLISKIRPNLWEIEIFKHVSHESVTHLHGIFYHQSDLDWLIIDQLNVTLSNQF